MLRFAFKLPVLRARRNSPTSPSIKHSNVALYFFRGLKAESTQTIDQFGCIWSRGVKLVGFWGPHCTYEQSCRGPHEVFDLDITTSSGKDLCNVARSEIDLQKKRSSLLQHLRIIALMRQIEFCCCTKWSNLWMKKNLFL